MTAPAEGTWQGGALKIFEKMGPIIGETVASQLLNKCYLITEIFREIFQSAGARKRVVLTFFVNGERNPRSKLWDPRERELADVLANAGFDVASVELQADILVGDEVISIDVTSKEDVDDLLQSVGDGPFLKINASIQEPSMTERAQASVKSAMDKASSWILGAKEQIVGKVPEETAVLLAERELESNADVHSSSKEFVALEYKASNLSEWPRTVELLAESLNMSDSERNLLQHAQHTLSTRDSAFSHVREGDDLKTTFTSYRTMTERDNGLIHLVYGHFRHRCSHKFDDSALRNTVSLNGRLFKAFPEASPFSQKSSQDMLDMRFRLPVGAKVVETSDQDFAQIVDKIIKPYGWGTDILVVHDVDKGWKGWRSANRGELRGSFWDGAHCLEADGQAFWFTACSFRLLVEVPNSALDGAGLSSQLQRYVEASARHEWAKLLNLNVGEEVPQPTAIPGADEEF